MWLNLEYSLGFYISMLSVLTMLLLHQKGKVREKEFLALLFAGIHTAYWDVLTYPMAALGLPLVAAFFLDPEQHAGKAIARMLRLCFFWGLGYGLMWVSRWIIGTVLTGQNVFEEGISSFLLRTGSEAYGEAATALGTIRSNLSYFLHTPVSFLLLVYRLALLLLLALRIRKKELTLREAGTGMIPFLLIACIPFV